VRPLTAGSLDPEGPVAETMANLWWLMLGIGAVVFVVVAVLLIGGLFRRRTAAGTDEPGTPGRPGGPGGLAAPGGPGGASGAIAATPTGTDEERKRVGRWLVAGGVAMPLVVLVVVFGATVAAMRGVPDTVPSEALEIEVVGHQWWWEVRYPAEAFTTANEIHLPVGRPVAFRLTSADVIHSFWVPALGGKLDLLPERTNTLILEADEPGRHRSLCAEFCGLQHALMGLDVVAEPAEAFAAWVAAQQQPAAEPPEASAASRGRAVFFEAGCAACHTISGTAAQGDTGPDLSHLASRAALGAATVANTRADLLEWVADPHAVKPGVEMPAARLGDEDLNDLVAYLEGLR
jgi:cytochrome c oxidase subunit 2